MSSLDDRKLKFYSTNSANLCKLTGTSMKMYWAIPVNEDTPLWRRLISTEGSIMR